MTFNISWWLFSKALRGAVKASLPSPAKPPGRISTWWHKLMFYEEKRKPKLSFCFSLGPQALGSSEVYLLEKHKTKIYNMAPCFPRWEEWTLGWYLLPRRLGHAKKSSLPLWDSPQASGSQPSYTLRSLRRFKKLPNPQPSQCLSLGQGTQDQQLFLEFPVWLQWAATVKHTCVGLWRHLSWWVRPKQAGDDRRIQGPTWSWAPQVAIFLSPPSYGACLEVQQTQLLFRASTRIFSELGKWLGSPESQFKSPTFPRLLLPPTAPYSSTQLAWPFVVIWTSLVAQMVKRLPTIQKTWVQSLGQEDLLEKEMATHSSILAWKIPWTAEPGRLQSMGLQTVGHDWATSVSSLFFWWLCMSPSGLLPPVPAQSWPTEWSWGCFSCIIWWVSIPFVWRDSFKDQGMQLPLRMEEPVFWIADLSLSGLTFALWEAGAVSQTIQCPLQAGTPTHPRVVHSGQEGDLMIDARGQQGSWGSLEEGLSGAVSQFGLL